MNLIQKINLYFIFSLLLLPLLSYVINPSDFTSTYSQFNNESTPISSGYWTLGPIHIEATIGIGAAYTWAEAVLEDWCSGDGSLLTPYLLENITIDAGGNDDALLIENSNGKYFTIRNCTLMNAGTNLMGNAGIKLDSSSNGTLENNFCLNNIKYGIIIQDGSNYNSIRNNFIYNSSHGGIRFDASNHNNVTSNEIIMGGDMFSTGVYISTSSSYNRVFHNNISDMRDGIKIFSSCHNNIISNNFINSILYDGIKIDSGASNNTFIMNKINNTDVGFRMMGDGSLVYNNYMTNTDQNAVDYGQYNRWDNGSLGNYWDDYGGSDQDDNGIGDTAHVIPGSANSYDNFPIWDDGFNGTAIHIDGTGISAPDWNWAKTRTWCTGEGSLLNPYLIKDISIDCGGVGSGIIIENSVNEYFIIQNCTIINAGDTGIKLDGVQNGTIFNNNCSNNYVGLYLTHCENINISNNKVYDNPGTGINLFQSKYNYICNNGQKGSWYSGLLLQGLSHNNTITGNNFTENTHATYDGDGINILFSNGNIVLGNLLKDNDRGIHVSDGSNENEITDNIIDDNGEYGILILRETRECLDNIIYANNIANPLGINAYDNGTNTQWDYLSQGNYWGDYTGVDNDDDGIGDTPYNILGTGLSQDNFPIWDDGLNPLPVIILNSPLEVSERIFGISAPTINITITDNDLVGAWYTINSGTTKYYFSPNNGINIIPINQTVWSALDEGSVTITIFANDTKGQESTLPIPFTKDIFSPQSAIPFGNYFILFMGISIISLLIIVSRKRKLIHS